MFGTMEVDVMKTAVKTREDEKSDGRDVVNRDIRKGQWQRWQQTSVSEEMWDNRDGGDGETGRRKRGLRAMRSNDFS